MARVFVGNLDPHVTKAELEDVFGVYGILVNVWIARRPPGFAFIEFEDRRDATDAVRSVDGKNDWRVELSHRDNRSGSGYGRRGGRRDERCHRCGESGHYARECNTTRPEKGIGEYGLGGRWRSRSPSSAEEKGWAKPPLSSVQMTEIATKIEL